MFKPQRHLAVRCAVALLLGLGALQAAPLQAAVAARAVQPAPQRLATLAEQFYSGYFGLFPLTATENAGDPAYEAAFEIDIAPAHRERERALYQRTLKALSAIDVRRLGREDRLTYELLRYEAQEKLAMLAYPSHLLPMTQLDSVPVRMAQWASGNGSQPMKTAAHYDHYLARLQHLPEWNDQAIANMEQGMAQGIVQPKVLMERVLAQLDSMLPADRAQSPFLAGVRTFPEGISAEDQARLRTAYENMVAQRIEPSVRKLRDFIAQRYVPRCRDTAGLGALPGGAEWYRALVKDYTTTTMPVEEIHALGLKEVARIRGEMEQVKSRMGFEGELNAFFKTFDARPELRPFHEEAEVLSAYAKLNERIKANLPRLFEHAPKAALEIRAVEPMRRDTASDNYVPPAADGSRPGVFFTVVQDPAKYRTTGMTALFLHEGQPGHHYQMALQQELAVPRFRKFLWYDAYGEGWALYAEGLGNDLGVYDDPTAYMGRLFNELHRAIRLVVDTGMHAKGWSREQAMRYVMDTEGSDEPRARRAIERYMAWPGQALAYKVGELKILQLRERARQALGPRFDIRAFHDQVLGDGSMPLSMLETKLDAWIRDRSHS